MECKKCHNDLPIEQFDPSPKRPGKLKPFCRACIKKMSAAGRASRRVLKQNGKGEDYKSRHNWLSKIGFSSYKEYLASPLWKEIRKKVYKAKGCNCYLCGAQATELHHNRYHMNDLLGKKLKFINPICRDCHEKIEFDEDGTKSPLKAAAARFKKIRKDSNSKHLIKDLRAEIVKLERQVDYWRNQYESLVAESGSMDREFRQLVRSS